MKMTHQETSGNNLQLLLLLAAGGTVFLYVPLNCLLPGMGYTIAEIYLAIPSLLFLASVSHCTFSGQAKSRLVLSGITMLWYMTVRMIHHFTYPVLRSFGLFTVIYFLAFPFAWVCREDIRKQGLKWIGTIYVVFTGVLLILTAMLLLDAVPEAWTSKLFWNGARLTVMWHPNVSAAIFMTGIGFCLYFWVQTTKTWVRIGLAGFMAMLLAAMSLTNSRTGILLTCGLLAGALFFRIWNRNRKTFVLGAAAALAVIAVLFWGTGKLFDLHTQMQSDKLLLQEESAREEALQGTSPQGSFSQDIRTLNGRTLIWEAAFSTLADNPEILIWGTEEVSSELSDRNPFPVDHSHNSWMEALLRLGIPGLALALVYTGMAIRSIWWALWSRDVDSGKKMVALLLLSLLAAGILEPYLFISTIHTLFANFLFFFCLGYLDCWREAGLHRQKSV